jgi:D-arabinose 1-dehydrogenase-like Zn-dependent alcohol dehydrogenase
LQLHIIARGKIGRSPEAELVERYLKRITWPTKLTELSERAPMPAAASGSVNPRKRKTANPSLAGDCAMILITGAAGKTGRALIQALAPKGVPVRALVRRPEQAEKVLALGAAEAQIGDLCQPDTVFRAAAGVQAVYHIPPNMHPDEITLGQTALSAASR